ncbi:LysM peptidoglycan-binding domain-containing M23 family metallopeptidase [Marinithermus hydrothermalis]|uniref:Peptidase M23 n=1 Tax=Marinithermus hydrothermalis (strain DSM 14884 / JCM 11576 / T1) TaxID=869210 RepID=F2NQN1_MARHT|nr:Peptidase M23 [Marinithermus hydrothermalis DSM 14884]
MFRDDWLRFIFAGALIGIPLSPLEALPDLSATSTQQNVIVLEPAPRRGVVYHSVAPGESLAALAERYRVSIEEIKTASGLKKDLLYPGQVVRIPIEVKEEREARVPPGVRVYTVRPGDTLEAIAKRFGLSILELVSANPTLPSLDRVVAGTRLLIPTEEKGVLVPLAEGESLPTLAARYGRPVEELARVNGIQSPLELKPGDWVLIPGVMATEVMARLEKQREEERRLAEERRRRLAEQRRREREAHLRQVAYRGSTSAQGFQWPLKSFRITSYYGKRRLRIGGSNFHTGLDMAAPMGTPIYAAKAGRVRVAGWSRVGYGLHVRIDHGGGVETLYGHMSRIVVKPGQQVQQGQLIGYVGSTGWSTGPHLHLEIRINGRTKNPMAYLP